ncbi:5-methyltetrahydropteroyltriglutamate--homocysteine S-methyltransferase [Thermodesulfitimonas sp.]
MLSRNLPLDAFRRAQRLLGIAGKPVVLGPFTFVKLSRVADWQRALEAIIPPYVQMLQKMEAAGVTWVQVDEPVLVCDVTAAELKALTATYTELARHLKNLKIMLQTYFGSANWFSYLIALPVAGIGLNFVRGRRGNLANLEHYGFPPDKVFGAGIGDGRNVWRTNIEEALRLLERLQSFVPRERLWLQPSCSLLHLPVTTAGENSLPPALREALAFADERLAELAILKRALTEGTGTVDREITTANRALRTLEMVDHRCIPAVRARVAALKEEDFSRPTPFAERKELQKRRLGLPPLPTTIGSFPQTPDVRAARARFRRGELGRQEYQALIREKIAAWIRLQERIGIDLLVHGEFERSDMVEYFAAQLPGFALTANGWVQSYGSRCVKPPILYGDVWRSQPLTVAETTYAQSLTSKPVKAILTGPVTFLKWSFVREDLSEQEIAYQLALVIRDEIRDLEREGIAAIQIDEPAFREGLPLRARDRERYLYWEEVV